MSSGKPHAQVAEDVAFMVEHGETNAEAIATRLGMTLFGRAANRHFRPFRASAMVCPSPGTSTPPWHDAKSTG